ncbi:MAG: ATP-binding protein, partial [Gemmataceae bacterium]|nr:ATP-binding protein [Gemmataceae bacterium]
PLARAASGQLDQVLLNLSANARDAMPEGGLLVLATRREGAWAVLEAIDTGCGMDGATLARTFDPFFTTKKEGSGLGMAIIREAAERWGGRAEAESEPGKGTRVRVRLPLAGAGQE